MKRLWIGITVLAVLLASGWAAAFFMERCHTPIRDDLTRAAQADPFDMAVSLAHDAHTGWLHCRDFTAAFADHSVLEEIDALFGEIEVYAAARDTISFSAACAHLSELVEAVAESHRPMWQNLL